jgi:hypothetical protein
MECQFELSLYRTGSLNLECSIPITTEFARSGCKQIDDNQFDLSTASFTGRTSDGGTVHIEEAYLENTTFNVRKFSSRDNPKNNTS